MTKYALIDQAIVSLANFIVSVLVARNMGLEYYGYYSLILIIAMFTQTVFLATYTQPMMSMSSKYSKNPQYHGTLYISFILTVTITTAVIYLIIRILSDKVFDMDISSYSLVVAVFIYTITLQDFTRRLLFAKKMGNAAIRVDIINYLGKVILLYVLMFYNMGSLLNVLIISIIISSLSIIYGNVKMRILRDSNYKNIIPVFTNHMVNAKWLIGSSLMQWFTGNSYVLAAGVIIGPEIVGIVRIAQNLMGLTHVFLIAMENFVPSNAVRIYGVHGVKSLKYYIAKVIGINFVFVTISLIVLLLFSEMIVGMLYGQEYTQYSTFIVFYIIVYYVLVSNAVLKIMLRTLNTTQWIFYGDLIASIFSSTTAYLIISSFDTNGLIYGTITSTLIVFSILLYGNVNSYQKELKRNETVNHNTII